MYASEKAMLSGFSRGRFYKWDNSGTFNQHARGHQESG
jgi:hypothetical protein